MTHDPAAALHRRLRQRLETLKQADLRRSLTPRPTTGRVIEVQGRPLLNLAGNDYLALAQHPALIRAAVDATRRYGTGSGASRLVTGHLDLHHRVEADVARFKHAEAALLFPTGYMANLAVITSLVQSRDDLVLQDRLNHASLIDAARFSGATVRTFPHRELAKAARLLTRHRDQRPDAQRFIVTDSVFSMDGDVADLPALADLCQSLDANLIVDEAHGTGVLGETGSGLIEQQQAVGAAVAVVSTASKALGGLGGIVTGSRVLIDTLINSARPMIYSTAATPAQTAALGAAVAVVRAEPWRRRRLAELATQLRQDLRRRGWRVPRGDPATPIIPLQVGSVAAALALQQLLRERGLLTIAIRPPTVPPGTARVRLSLRADLSDEDLATVLDAVGSPQ